LGDARVVQCFFKNRGKLSVRKVAESFKVLLEELTESLDGKTIN
jgi:hypothetical protein